MAGAGSSYQQSTDTLLEFEDIQPSRSPPQLTFVTISPGPWSLSWRIRPQLISEITVTLLDVMVTCDKYISQQQHWQQRSGSLGWLNLIFSMPIIKKFQKSTSEQTIQSLFLLPTLNTTASTFRPEHEDLYQEMRRLTYQLWNCSHSGCQKLSSGKNTSNILNNVKMFVFEARGGRGQSIKYSNYG